MNDSTLFSATALSDGLNQFASQLFARQQFTSNLLERSFNRPEGWVELGICIAVMAAAFWLSGFLIKRHLKSVHKRKTPLSTTKRIVRHIMSRLLWPFLMLIGAVAALYCWSSFSSHNAVWLHLLAMAARWMMIIRLVLAVVHSALPVHRFTDRLERWLSWGLWIAFVLWITGIDDIIVKGMKSIGFSVGSAKLNLYTITTGLIWVAVMMVFALWLARYISEKLEHSSLDRNLSMILSKLAKTVMMVLAVLIALPLVGIDLTVLSVFGGALGVGIGFGLQKVASNYISGFIILGDRSIRMNDRLTVNDFTGYVTKITSRFVVLQNANGTEALIPNETFVTSTVINESYTGKELMQFVNIQVAYHTDLVKALDILKTAAANQPRIASNPSPLAVITNFGENGIDLRLSFWVKDPENGFSALLSAVLLDIWKQFNEYGIEFPFPQREIRILNEEQAPSDIAMLKAAIGAKGDTKSDTAFDDDAND